MIQELFHSAPTPNKIGDSAGPVNGEEVLAEPWFHLDLWVCFTLHSWVLDVGQPIVMLVSPSHWSPLGRPGPAEYLQLLYTISTPLLLLKVLDRSPRTLPRLAVYLGIIAVVMGASIHLVADYIMRRLLLMGYQLHLPLRDNPVMRNLEPSSLLFLVLFLFFSSCFCHKKKKTTMAAWILFVPNTVYYWYLITEGQTFILFIFTFFAMTATVMHQKRQGLVPNGNGMFMIYSFSAALVLVAVWVLCLWDDAVLRRKHPGLIYVPQPRAVYSLHLRRHN
ncbi:ceroid-lipofuscinosis neuronal protein 6 homolog [Aulostomus maculatus]